MENTTGGYYDKKINFTQKVVQQLGDKRTSYLVDHQLIDLLRQRIYGIIAGNEVTGREVVNLNHFLLRHYIAMDHHLLFFDGTSGDLLSIRLRPGNGHGSHRLDVDLRRIVKELRKKLAP